MPVRAGAVAEGDTIDANRRAGFVLREALDVRDAAEGQRIGWIERHSRRAEDFHRMNPSRFGI